MESSHITKVDEALSEAAQRFDFVLVPGLYDSGPDHWQSLWQARHGFWLRLTMTRWNTSDMGYWIDGIRRQLAHCKRPAILVGHSLGALASASVAASDPGRIAGVFLVAPAEPLHFDAEELVPAGPLGLPALVLASQDDPVIRFARAEHWCRLWGAEFMDMGEAGHVNAESGYGPWPYGLDLLLSLVKRIG